MHPRFSPNGRWLAYASNQTGAYEVYVSAFPDGATRRVSNNGGNQPRWRGDGKELFYISADGYLSSVETGVDISFKASEPRPLFRPQFRSGEGPHYDVTRNGQRFLAITGVQSDNRPGVEMILNWPSLLG